MRGLLCGRCRAGLTTFREDMSVLRAAVGYLLHTTPASLEAVDLEGLLGLLGRKPRLQIHLAVFQNIE